MAAGTWVTLGLDSHIAHRLVSHIAFLHVASSNLSPEGGGWACTSFTGSERRNATCSFSRQGLWEIICSWNSRLCLARHCHSKVPENLPCAPFDLHWSPVQINYSQNNIFSPLCWWGPLSFVTSAISLEVRYKLLIYSEFWNIIFGNYVNFSAS